MPEPHIPTSPAIDAEAAGRLLRRIEAHHDMTGWHDGDGNMWVYVIYERDDVVMAHHIGRVMQKMGEPIRNARYVAQPMLPPRKLYEGRRPEDHGPPDALRRFALNIAFADLADDGDDMAESMAAFRSLLQQPGIVGYAACHEGYGWKASLLPRRIPPAGCIQDDPDSQEMRIAYLVDINDLAHRVTRWRGEPAELRSGEMRGNVSTSLRILADLTAGRLPEANPEAFSARYPDADLHVDMA